jgi:hypothetical protein
MATLLSIVQDVQDELGLPRASAVASATTPTERQMLALLNREGQALVKLCEWPKLLTLATITTVNGTSDYAVPDDFDRFVDQTAWDRANDTEMLGPDIPQVDRWYRESDVATSGIYRRYRYIGGYIRVWPTPTVSSEEIVYEYVSKNWCQTTGGTAKARMSIDTDEPRVDDQLLILGLKWRFLNTKGLDASGAKAEYDMYLDSMRGSEKGGGPINMEGAGGGDTILVDMSNAPDSGYGS